MHFILVVFRTNKQYAEINPALQNTKSTESFRKYISLLHSLQIYSFVSLNPLAPELSAWCTLQKTRNVNGHSLLCTSLANDIRCHFNYESACLIYNVVTFAHYLPKATLHLELQDYIILGKEKSC
jgi:hypothetical protein